MAGRTIIVSGDYDQFEDTADAALSPGYLLEVTATGVKKHAGAGLNAERIFARENDIIGGDTATAYALGDNVLIAACKPGAVVYAKLAAAAAAITRGLFLESAGDGTLRKLTTDAATDDTQRASVVGVAMEAVDNSAGGSEAWIKVRVL